MSSHSPDSPENHGGQLRDASGKQTARDVSIIILIALVLFVPPLLTRDVWYPDGVRYMEVAREMVALDDYIVPHLNGEVYTGKPPLQFWLSAGLYRAGLGIDSGRIVAACMSLGIMLLVYFFGRRLLRDPGGLLAAAIAGTTFLLHDITKQGVIDPLLTFLTTTAFMASYFALRKETQHRWLWWLLFYGTAGLAVLAKGPVGFVMPGCVVLAYALLNRKHIGRGGWIHAVGVALFLAVVGAWLVPAYFRGGESYIRSIVFGEQAIYTVQASSHVRGPHYYLMKLPFHLFPWFFFGALGTAQCLVAWRKKGDRDAAFLAVWFLATLAFFSVVPSKRGRYLMPLVPALALITARYIVIVGRESPPWRRLNKASAILTFWPPALAAILLIPAAPIALATSARMFSNDPALKENLGRMATMVNMLTTVAVALVVLPAALGSYRLMAKKAKPVHAALLLAALVLFSSVVADLFVHPLLHPVRMQEFFDARVLPHLEKAEEAYLHTKEFCGAVNLYAGVTDFPVIASEDPKDLERLLIETLDSPRKVAVFADKRKLRKMTGGLPATVNVIARTAFGNTDLVLLRNWRTGELKQGAKALGE